MPEIKPLVSVVLPLFQGEDFLADSFESLLSQSLKDFEVIVLDDCSTDASFEIAERYSSLDKRIKVGRNPRRAGLFANYNLCIAEATGTFLKPMAQDDLLDPNMLEKCVEALSAHERATLVSTGRDYIDVRGEVVDVNGFKVPHSRLFESARVVSGAKVIDECLVPLQNIIGEPSTVLFHRRNALEGFDERFFHLGDLELWLRLLELGDYIHLPEKLVKFRTHEKSASTRNASQLNFAVDLVRMAKAQAPLISSRGYSEREFVSLNLSSFASHLFETASLDDFDECSLLSDVTLSRAEEYGLKRSLLGALELVAQQNSKNRMVLERKAITRAESVLRLLMNSFPWKVTRVLRELNRHSIESVPALSTQEESTDHKFQTENDYLGHLRNQRRTIIRSRSWQVGRRVQTFFKSLSEMSVWRSKADCRPLSVNPYSLNTAGAALVGDDSAVSVPLNKVVVEQLERLRSFEPLIPSASSISSLPELRSPSRSNAGRAYSKLLKSVNGRFTNLFLISSGDRLEVQQSLLCRVRDVTLRLRIPDSEVLVVDVDGTVSSGNRTHTPRLISLDFIHPGLSDSDKAYVLLRLVLQTNPQLMINVGSALGWKLFRASGRQLSAATRLSACLFRETPREYPAENHLVFLSHCIEWLKYLLVSDSDYEVRVSEALKIYGVNELLDTVEFIRLDDEARRDVLVFPHGIAGGVNV